MNTVMIIPTGLGFEIGGHAGDATPAAKVLAAVSDNLLLHPNVVNASDINEMPTNAWYVEGSMLDAFLEGQYCLKRPHSNRILVVVNSPILNEIINAVSAARMTIGANIEVLELTTPLVMIGELSSGKATGHVTGCEELIVQVQRRYNSFDALAISSPIIVNENVKKNYWANGGPNPWGAVEAIVSRQIAMALRKPVAHAPYEDVDADSYSYWKHYNDVVDPRMNAEMLSAAYIHCVLKGLHRAPRISDVGLNAHDIDVLVSPWDCYGPAHVACEKVGIPIIAVHENKANVTGSMPSVFITASNYLEAAGIVAAMRAGVYWKTVRRPLCVTNVDRLENDNA